MGSAALFPILLLLVATPDLAGASGSSRTNFHYEKGPVAVLAPCPGHYCGRTLLSNGSWSGCGACERGSRRNSSSACLPCTDSPTLYDWVYLGFMLLAPLVLHLLCVDLTIKKNKVERRGWMVYLSVVVEVAVAAVVTLLVTPPLGSLRVVACNPRRLADWYPLMHNPNPNYDGYLHCTQEAVYPLYSMVLVLYSVLLVVVLVLRPAVGRRVAGGGGGRWRSGGDTAAVYSALYFLPVLTVLHALLAGVLYEVFPFLVIAGSVISCATYLAYQRDQSMRQLVFGCVRDSRSVLILLGHWALHAYGILALTALHDYHVPASLCALVPAPALFYVLTARFSDPANLPLSGGPRPPSPLSRGSMSLTL